MRTQNPATLSGNQYSPTLLAALGKEWGATDVWQRAVVGWGCTFFFHPGVRRDCFVGCGEATPGTATVYDVMMLLGSFSRGSFSL